VIDAVAPADATSFGVQERIMQVVLAALAIAAIVVAIEPLPVGVFQDDGVYTLLAKSLATGQGYRYLHLPDAPAATHFPPLYPLVLAGLWKLFPSFPENVTLFKFANAAFIGVAAVMGYRFARRAAGMQPWTAVLTVGAFTICAPIILLGVMVMSEPLFLAALFPVLALGHRATVSGNARDALFAGLAAGALTLVRTLGVVVIPATVMVLVWRRRWAAAAVFGLASVALMLPWQLWVAAHDADLPAVLLGKYGSYAGWLMDGMRDGGIPWVLDLVWFNIRLCIGTGWEMLTVEAWPVPLRFLSTAVATSFFLLGWWQMMKRAPVAALTVAGYMMLVVAWPFPPERFTFGIWPLLGLHFGLAFETVARWRPSTRALAAARHGAVALGVLLFAGYARKNYVNVRNDWWTDVQSSVAFRTRPIAEWVNAHSPEDAVISTEDDVMLHLYTGRRAVPIGTFTPRDHMSPPTTAASAATLRSIVQTFDVDYVLASTPWGANAALALAKSQPPELRLRGTLAPGGIFETVKRSTAP
jgi:hypothetical protein